MKRDVVEVRIAQACDNLYHSELSLIKTKTHERTIAAHLVSYLKPLFEDFGVDAEYNREGAVGEPKRDLDGNLLRPDIIIHFRHRIHGPNIAAIQIKGYWNNEDRGKDENDLRKLRAKYGYAFTYRLELKTDSYDLIPVTPG